MADRSMSLAPRLNPVPFVDLVWFFLHPRSFVTTKPTPRIQELGQWVIDPGAPALPENAELLKMLENVHAMGFKAAKK